MHSHSLLRACLILHVPRFPHREQAENKMVLLCVLREVGANWADDISIFYQLHQSYTVSFLPSHLRPISQYKPTTKDLTQDDSRDHALRAFNFRRPLRRPPSATAA